MFLLEVRGDSMIEAAICDRDWVVVGATRAAPARVLLVDDVHTTGATLRACARALREAGATSVHALTYGRAL